jgi:hypothetical protein
MAKDDILRDMSLLPQWEQTAVTSLPMERTKNDETIPQSWHLYS